jgi:hypothetical protein
VSIAITSDTDDATSGTRNLRLLVEFTSASFEIFLRYSYMEKYTIPGTKAHVIVVEYPL